LALCPSLAIPHTLWPLLNVFLFLEISQILSELALEPKVTLLLLSNCERPQAETKPNQQLQSVRAQINRPLREWDPEEQAERRSAGCLPDGEAKIKMVDECMIDIDVRQGGR
jgi:hypothetical protein